MPRPVGESHRLAGAWAYDHGVTVYLNLEREHSRNSADDCLGFVILCRPVRPAGVGHTSGCVNLEFARISTTKYTGALACENASLPWKAKPHLLRVRRVLRDARGVTPFAESRFASADHSAHCSGSSAPSPFFERRGRHSLRTGHNGRGLRAGRESPDSGEPLAVRNAERGSVPSQPRFRAKLHAAIAFGQFCTVVRLPGASQWLRSPSGYPDVKPGREASARIDAGRIRCYGSWCWRGGDQAVLVLAVKTRG